MARCARGSRDSPVAMAKHWIKGAIKHPGAERKVAERAGESTATYAKQHEDASGVAGHRARLALVLMHLNKKKI